MTLARLILARLRLLSTTSAVVIALLTDHRWSAALVSGIDHRSATLWHADRRPCRPV